ncbi:MAG: DUF1064 domain-containing protein [Desulfobacteraceae bacterium]|nr:DUF1064 domain-containing protein [Desulfobacteraceae bacterium]
MKKRSKYNAVRTMVDGITFDSKKEAARYCALKTMLKVGAIKELTLQPEFVLQEKFRSDGRTIRAIKYLADFQYSQGGRIVVEDVKGMKTQVYQLKKKLFLNRFPEIDFREV